MVGERTARAIETSPGAYRHLGSGGPRPRSAEELRQRGHAARRRPRAHIPTWTDARAAGPSSARPATRAAAHLGRVHAEPRARGGRARPSVTMAARSARGGYRQRVALDLIPPPLLGHQQRADAEQPPVAADQAAPPHCGCAGWVKSAPSSTNSGSPATSRWRRARLRACARRRGRDDHRVADVRLAAVRGERMHAERAERLDKAETVAWS